jgi:hypothetical protein
MEKYGIFRNYITYENNNNNIYKSPNIQKIIELLNNKGIIYNTNISFNWLLNHNKKFDIYLPQYDILIEYDNNDNYDNDTQITLLALSNKINILKINEKSVYKNGFLNTKKIEYYLNKLIKITNYKKGQFGKLLLCEKKAYFNFIKSLIDYKINIQQKKNIKNLKKINLNKNFNVLIIIIIISFFIYFIYLYFSN